MEETGQGGIKWRAVKQEKKHSMTRPGSPMEEPHGGRCGELSPLQEKPSRCSS